MATKKAQQEQAEAIAHLRGILKPGDTVGTILRHVSRSGMLRHISLLVGTEEISGWAACATGEKWAKNGGIKAGGCGMDMGFQLVYSLSRTLFPAGFDCINPENRDRPWCPSSHHSNSRKPEEHHTDGGYALRHRWL